MLLNVLLSDILYAYSFIVVQKNINEKLIKTYKLISSLTMLLYFPCCCRYYFIYLVMLHKMT
jgi:hypothetical protein